MRLLLDTHVVLWWLGGSRELSKQARSAIASSESLVWVSIASAWEIAIKKSIGKLKVPDGLQEELDRHQFVLLPIEIAHTEALAKLPPLHRDPFDRMLVAQAQEEGLTLVTRDANVISYGSPVLKA